MKHVILVIAWVAGAATQTTDFARCAQALDRGDFTQAARVAQNLVHLNARSVPAHLLLARAHMGLNEAPLALSELHAALRLDPNNLDALYYFSKLTEVLSRQAFLDLAQMAPDSARVHQLKGDGFAASGDATGAEKEYLAALEKSPGAESILIALGDLERHAEKYDEALGWYQKVLAKDPGNYDALYGAGACQLFSRRHEDAVSLFRKALKADPTSLAVKMALGEALLVTGRGSEAVALLEQAANADPDLQRLQYLLARAYQAAGRTADAQRTFRHYRALAGTSGKSESPASEEHP